MEVLALNQEENFQVRPVDIHLVQVYLEDPEEKPGSMRNQEDRMVIHLVHQDRQDFQADVQAVDNNLGDNNQVDNNLDFHPAKGLPVDILGDVPPFHFRAVNQQADLEQVQVGIHLAGQVHQPGRVHDQEDFQRGQVLDILVAGLMGKHQAIFQVDKDLPDIRVDSQKVPDILVHDRVGKDQTEDIPVEYKGLVVREVDILVEGQALDIQEVLRDLVVVQVVRDQVGIQDRVALKDLEVSKVQVKHLPAVILEVNRKDRDQEAIQVAQARKDQEAISVAQVLKDHQVAILVSQAHKNQTGIQEVQGRKDQEDFQVDQVDQFRKDQENFLVDQVRKDQKIFQVDQERKN